MAGGKRPSPSYPSRALGRGARLRVGFLRMRREISRPAYRPDAADPPNRGDGPRLPIKRAESRLVARLAEQWFFLKSIAGRGMVRKGSK